VRESLVAHVMYVHVSEGQGSSWWFWMKPMLWHRTHRMHCAEVRYNFTII